VLGVRPIRNMSESAANVKLFFILRLHKISFTNTLQATGAEGKSLLGSKLSADSGAKTRLGLGDHRTPAAN
jgi:hypothetical protein